MVNSWPRTADKESWIEIHYQLGQTEYDNLPEDYQLSDKKLIVRRYLKSEKEADRVKSGQSNLYGLTKNGFSQNLLFGAKNIGQAKLGQIIYIPALSTPDQYFKTSGPSSLREILNFILKKAAASTKPYQELLKNLEALNVEAKKDGGFLGGLSTPLNQALLPWGIQIEMGIGTIDPEDISKNLIQTSFKDADLPQSMGLDRYGHGFQRTVIYELLRLVPQFREPAKLKKKEFSTDFCLILFEEPEAFLHPHQQEVMAHNLRILAQSDDVQVLVTTHSPIFASRSMDNGRLLRTVRCLQSGKLTENQVDLPLHRRLGILHSGEG